MADLRFFSLNGITIAKFLPGYHQRDNDWKMKKNKSDRVLDLRGWSCPWCILKAKSLLKRMSAGQILEVLITDPEAQVNFPLILKKSK